MLTTPWILLPRPPLLPLVALPQMLHLLLPLLPPVLLSSLGAPFLKS